MTITRKEIEHIANLARLELSDEETTRYEQQLTNILDFFGRLRQIDDLDTSDDPEVENYSATRVDEPVQQDVSDQILANSAEVEKGQFKIPPVF